MFETASYVRPRIYVGTVNQLVLEMLPHTPFGSFLKAKISSHTPMNPAVLTHWTDRNSYYRVPNRVLVVIGTPPTIPMPTIPTDIEIVVTFFVEKSGAGGAVVEEIVGMQTFIGDLLPTPTTPGGTMMTTPAPTPRDEAAEQG